MTFNELYQVWGKNINSEYILPTLDNFYDTNIIVPIEKDIEETIRQLNYYINLYEVKLEQERRINVYRT